jgi:uncharacterized protein (DUF697 family)
LQVNEAEIQNILHQVRSELPTTEVLLVGKPQAGKSSLIRGLTGVSAAIVGQGFRPHTQHTQRYIYPVDDLPLLVFTDTVGLGDSENTSEDLVQELSQILAPVEDAQGQAYTPARILIVTVKISDFATHSLQQILTRLRQNNPTLPCLLVVTCLHEVYPSPDSPHPPYPPQLPAVERAFAALKKNFAPLWDQAVLVDFTLEEDGYNPVFYGLENLRDSLAELLPQAEARAIHQLLEGETGKRIGTLYRDVARRYSLAFALLAATLASVPLPFATMPVLTALQVSLVTVLGKLYGQTLTPSQAASIISTIAGGFLAQAVGRELIKIVPGLGTVIAASWAGAYTWSLGEGACIYFGDLLGGKKPDPRKIQGAMKEAFQQAQHRLQQAPPFR